MSQVFSEGNEVLQKLWKQYNPNDEEYLQKEKVIQWVKAALKQTNTLQNFEQSMTDLDGLIRQYLSEVHEVTQDNNNNISMSYTQAVDFLKWLTNTNQQQKQLDQAVKQLENSNHIQLRGQVHRLQQEQNQQNHEEQQAKQPFQQQSIQEYHNNSQKMKEIIKSPPKHQKLQQSIHSKRGQKIEQMEHNFKKVKTEIIEKQNDLLNNDQDINENQTNNPNQFNLQHLSRKYKDYLRVIFDHYCKASYATGQDPTFQQIMHKTTIMTINKFMMFCKDFQISKTHPTINRNFLIEIFKKNSQCYKQMSFEQFCTVFKKLSTVGLQQKPQTQDKGLLTNQMVKLLQFCQLSTAKKFKQKLKRLNIQYRAGPKTNAQLKVVPQGYKFKFTSNNGKSQEQIMQQINQRKINRSQRKLFLRQKVNLNQNQFSLNKKSVQVKKKDLNISKEKPSFTRQIQNQTQSNQIINKILTPITHVSKKNPLPPPPPPKSNNTPVQNHAGSNSNKDNNANLFKKQLGYAQLHKIKQTETYTRKRAITNSNTRSHDAKGAFKLNSIVQQARMQVMDMNNQIHSQQLTQSLATNSREETNRLKSYDMNKINHKMQEINDKIKRDRQIQQQLTGLLDIDNDEQDQYLIEHLERQKKNQSIVKRLSNKINQL